MLEFVIKIKPFALG